MNRPPPPARRANLLKLDLFSSEPVLLGPITRIGDGVEIRYAENAGLICNANIAAVTDAFGASSQALFLRCENRQQGEWMAIEVDVSGDVSRAEIGMRFGPAERFFPRIYYRHRGENRHFDEPDRAAPERFAVLQFNVSKWRSDLNDKGITPERLWFALQFPERPWFVAAVTSVRRL